MSDEDEDARPVGVEPPSPDMQWICGAVVDGVVVWVRLDEDGDDRD